MQSPYTPESDDDIYNELFISNGIDPEQETEFGKVHHLEFFFLCYPRIIFLDKFPNLTSLVIMGQEMESMAGLEQCPGLTELWICECRLKKIQSLDNFRYLKKLFLYTNQITRIENMEHLSLETLWLSANRIEVIEGLQHMRNLKELNLAKNHIRSIDTSLNNFKNLENLNLSGNLVNSFEDVINLQNLPKLKELSFRDPQYGNCPLTYLCNYAIFMVYHFPELQRLDTIPIGQKSLKDLADASVNKKKLWYNMRLNTLNREIQELQEKLSSVKKTQIEPINAQKKVILSKIKDIEKFHDEIKDTYDNSEAEDKVKKQLIIFHERLKEFNRKLQMYENQQTQALNRIEHQKNFEKNFILMELENGGNIRFEFGKNDDLWFKSCQDLMLSRFCSSDFILRSINGIKIHKIIRVTNRLLVTKFEDSLFNFVDENEYLTNKTILRKQVDYLLYCWRPQLGPQLDELYEIIKNGFRDLSDYKNCGIEAGIPFTNSLSVSDHFRIESLKNPKAALNNSINSFKYGYALLCKVFTNNFGTYERSFIHPDNYKDKIGVVRQFASTTYSKMYTNGNTNNNSNNSNTNQNVSVSKEFLDTQRICDCKKKQAEWFVFNKNLAVPEYIIEYEYLNKFPSESVFGVDLTISNVFESMAASNNQKLDNSANEFWSPSRNNAADIIEQVKNDPTIAENFINLNFHNCQLTQISSNIFRSFRCLKKLTISNNNLTSLKELCYMYSLEYLDASNNKIDNINGFKGLPKLTYLDLSYNQFNDLTQLLASLRQYFPNIAELNIADNPFRKSIGLRLLCVYYLKNLTCLNCQAITGQETDTANGKKFTPETVVNHSLYILNRPRTLKYSFVSDYCKTDKNIQNHLFYDENQTLYSTQLHLYDSNWQYKVTVLYLDNQQLFKLTHVGNLVNLRWASFNNNYLTRLEGLETCTKLEELSVENNYLKAIENLEPFQNLRKLNLANNEITYDSTVGDSENVEITLQKLNYLSLNNNKIKSLKFLQKLPALLELYVNFNDISNIREIFNLKQMLNLVIIDLWCNPMCDDQKYRLFIIYHLKNLKSLDGYPIEQSECMEAKDLFGGKLTCDFIAEKFANIQLNELRSLDLPQCSIRYVDFGSPQVTAQLFENLHFLNLENNCLTSFSGLIYLKNLKTLCLNYNKIESIFPKNRQVTSTNIQSAVNSNGTVNGVKDAQTIMESLEVLHLGYNGITDLAALQLSRLMSLKALFLQGNEIVKVEGLENLRNLRELVLDKNKIKYITDTSFISQSQRLLELHIEENRLKDLTNFDTLKNIEKLYVANNKISELCEIDRVVDLVNMQELSLINNPVSRKPHYRITVVDRLPRLRVLDMVEITDDDRSKAEVYFSEQYQQQLQQPQPQLVFNTLQTASQAQMPSTTMNITQLDHQFIAPSPRLKPILFMDKIITNVNPQSYKSKSKNGFDKMQKDLQKFK